MVMLTRPPPPPRSAGPHNDKEWIKYNKKFAFTSIQCKHETVWLKSYYEKFKMSSYEFGNSTWEMQPVFLGNLTSEECMIDKLTGDL